MIYIVPQFRVFAVSTLRDVILSLGVHCARGLVFRRERWKEGGDRDNGRGVRGGVVDGGGGGGGGRLLPPPLGFL